jgi:hypothetical protein
MTMRAADRTYSASWFHTPAGRRYYRHFGMLLAAKLALLLILYFVFIAPQPRADTSPTAVFSALVHGGAGQGTDQP